MQEGINAACILPPRPHRLHQPLGQAGNLGPLRIADARSGDQRGDQQAFIGKERRA